MYEEKISELERIIGKQAIYIEILKNFKDVIDVYEVGISLYLRGYRVIDICKALELKRSTFYRKLSRIKKGQTSKNKIQKEEELNEELLNEIKELKLKHPFWDYRRIWAYLRYRKGYKIHQKRVYRIMKGEGLLNRREKKLKAERKFRSKPKASKPREYLGIDGTKFWINGLGWVTLIILIDWYTQEILSYGLYLRNRRREWEEVLFSGLEKGFFEAGIGLSGLKLVSDHGSQPTSIGFMKFCKEYGIRQVFAT